MNGLDRRQLICGLLGLNGLCAVAQDKVNRGSSSVDLSSLSFKNEGKVLFHEALYWEKKESGLKITCKLCPHECVVADQERGTCGVRENRNGKYHTLVHSQICAANIDPIEKKPLFHYYPGTDAFSIATPGCNMECQYCQNWQISQFGPEQIACQVISPEQLVHAVRRKNTPTIAYTYSEPVVFYEYMTDIAEEARKHGIGNVMISSGYIQQEPLKALIPKLDAVKIDFKGFSEEFYTKICRGKLKPVLDALVTIKSMGVWLELVMLVVPTLNDSPDENRKMFDWINVNLGPDVPLHLTRFHPTYKLKNLPSTPVSTLERLHGIARESGLNYVYVGNVWQHPTENTMCPSCDQPVIRRIGFKVTENNIRNGKCPSCGRDIPGVFK